MNDLIRVNALLTSDDEAGTEDVPEIEDEEGQGNIDEEGGVVDTEAASWQ